MASERAHFTYVWTIENVSEFHLLRSRSSPVFIVKSMGMTKFRLMLSLYSSLILRLSMKREADDNGPEEIEIEYELSFLGSDGLPLIKRADIFKFSRDDFGDMCTYADKKDVFFRRREQFLPKNIFTVRCRMWRNETKKLLLPNLCFARTRFGIERHCFVWSIREFTKLPFDYKTTRLLESTYKRASHPNLTFSFNKYYGTMYVCVEFNIGTLRESDVLSGEVAVLDSDGVVVRCEKIFIHSNINLSSLKRDLFDVQELLTDKTTFIPNDVLSLRCQFEIFHDPIWEGIENQESLECSEQVIKTGVTERFVENSQEDATGHCPFWQNIHKFFIDGTFSDITLRASSETFPVHKIILSSCSPVFEAMFTSDMKEKINKCVDVPDVDTGTLRLMLSHMYTNEVPDLQWERAVDLFRAADKYALLGLKKHCSTVLNSNITRTNACCILFLSDLHHDEKIQKAVIDFISKNMDIISSDEWKKFKKENPELAMKTMETLLLEQHKL